MTHYSVPDLLRGARSAPFQMIATMSTPRATQDMEKYLAELARHDSPTDRQILDVWQKMLDTGPSPDVATRDRGIGTNRAQLT